ncbi:MAG: transglycosylase domain-containing protein [Clostridia bacterium]|nr:transglycosylase domain-containing protein [Clostridia bacterium]
MRADVGKRKRNIWRAVACVGLALLLLSAVFVGCVQRKFQTELSEELLGMQFFGGSPRFFAYTFEDRANRVGVAHEVTETLYAQRQTAYVKYEDIPKALIDAFVAIEDKRFFEHAGVDWYRTLAAGANYLLGFSDRFGASTITQQLIKNMTGDDDVSVRRKLQEILYARDLERRLDKRQIMELYLNVIHFSDHCDGIGAAAEHYFSKTPAELSVAECATIAAITNNPSYYNPIRHPENNRRRRDLILSAMHEQGYLSDADYRAALDEETVLKVDDVSNTDGINSWYTDMVIADVIADLMAKYGMSRAAASHLVYTGGLRIDLAIDETVQAIVEDYYRFRVRLAHNEEGESAQSAIIVIDSRTGDILGVAGAIGEKKGNHLQSFATQTLRPPGSTIKPLTVYAPALEEGIIRWASVYDDVPISFKSGAWPKNANGIYRGLTNIAYAVAHSTNTVAVRVLEELGHKTSFQYAKERFHLSHLTDRDNGTAALALGQLHHGVTLRELTAAYTPFADAGVYHPYRSYYRVTDADGRILLACPDRSEVVMAAPNAAIMTKLLQGVISEGTSSSLSLREICECAGKTGTTTRDSDRWFIGYTPDLICGVWCGYAYPEPLTGKNPSAAIWNGVMCEIVRQTGGRRRFDVPQSLVRVSYCKDSGKLMTDACAADPRGSRVELGWFVAGSEPTDFCDCHVLVPRASETEEGETEEYVGLIRVKRRFPYPIYVGDAEYALPDIQE